MEVGTEISQKIRSAIKAKLMELGSYVDDELPDYIMVMVANKKSRTQMKNDLGLFLGANTDTFTEWLHGLIGKLQSIRGENDKQEKGEKSKGSKEKKKEKLQKSGAGKKDGKEKKKSGKRSSENSTKRKVSTTGNAEDSDKHAGAGDVNDSFSDNRKSADSVESAANNAKRIATASKNSQEEIEDVRQLLVTETPRDELAEELETTEVEVVNSKTVKDTAKSASSKKISDDVSHSPNQDGHNIQTSNTARKRKVPTSVVANVSRVAENEEEYDPYNPAVGSVASVVKVTSRKSSVPASLQANRALLVKAMSEAERSIAVKRKVAVTKPMSRDDSPSEVYSPKRKRSREEASPPPYIPSKKESVGRFTTSSTSGKRTEPRALSRDDARHSLSREDRRELISKSRREELLRTIGINKESSRKAAAPRSPEKDDRSDNTHRDRSDNTHRDRSDNTHRDINVTFKREVKSDRNSGTVKNFQITTRVVSQRAVARSEERQVSPSPEPRRSLTVQGREVNSKSSVIARLGKVVVERKDSVEDDDEEDDDERDSRATVVKASASQRDAREDIKAKAALSKSQTSVGRKPGARSISQQARDAVQKQCQAAVISVTATRDKSKGSDSPDRREVHCDRESYVSDEDDDERHDVMRTERKSVQMKAVTNRDVSDSPSRGQSNQSDDEAEDLDKMIDDDDLEPTLLDDTHNDEFTLDLEDDDISNVVGVIEEEAAEADKLAKEKSEETKAGTRFIVTLDGVDERQFDGADSSTTFDKLRRPPLGSNPIPVAPVAASNLAPAGHNQKLFLDILAAQGRPLPHTLLQQAQTSPSLQAKLTPPKIQPFSISLKDSDDEHDDKEGKSASVRHESYHQPQGELEEDVGISALKRARLSERCKFWPACAAGTACDYHHPTTHCKTFPNCKFGDKCLFIHPNCKFDAKCARPDCPYTHTSRRGNVTSAAHVIAIPQSHFVFSPAPPKPQYPYLGTAYPGTQTVCRYFPNCHNLTCPFVHPKPCRFGMACNSPACPFYHPPVPGKDKLKWQAQPSQHKIAADATTGQVKTELLVSKVSSATSVSQSTGVSSTSL